jgi:hypothetical protein
MAYTRVITGLALIGALAAAPLFAKGDDGQRRRDESDRRSGQRVRGDGGQARERSAPQQRESDRQRDRDSARRHDEPRRDVDAGRQYQPRRDDHRRAVQRPYYQDRGGYGRRSVIVPRYIRPRIVTVVPYRPYVYRPSLGIGVYYGAGGSYPYGYTPRGYYDPIPGRIYGGLRITDAPREAQVFADGYYIGIVNDFDGAFQHANLEAGSHRIEIEAPGLQTVAFDVLVQPGRTITLRADMYRY